MPKPRKRKPSSRAPKSAKDYGALSGRTIETNATSRSDSRLTRANCNLTSTIEADLEILKVLYAVQFTGFLRGHTSEEWTRRWTNGDLAKLRKCDDPTMRPIPPLEDDGHAFDDVPDYVLSAIVSTQGVSHHKFTNAIRLLEAREDIHQTREENWYGRWCTEDGHIIEVSWGNRPLPPLTPPYHAIVKLDGESFQQMWQFIHPVGKCYALTAQGIKRAETAGGKEPETEAAQLPARQSPDQLPLIGGGRRVVPQEQWLTVSECAELLLKDISGIDLDRAMARVSWAASEGKFRTNEKTRTARRIERVSFSAWRLEQREQDLDKEDH